MNPEHLMVHEVTHRKRTGETQALSGETTPTFTESSTEMYLEPRTGQEIEAERNTPIGDWIGYGKASVVFDSTDEIIYGDHTFEVVGPPEYKPNPRLDIISHVQLDLQEIT